MVLVGCKKNEMVNIADTQDKTPIIEGKGYCHYHIYPNTGQTLCAINDDLSIYNKKIAASSPSIHDYFNNTLCDSLKYLYVTAVSTGKTVKVAIRDKGGIATNDFSVTEQHIMDISQEAFTELDIDSVGYQTGRIYIDWYVSNN